MDIDARIRQMVALMPTMTNGSLTAIRTAIVYVEAAQEALNPLPHDRWGNDVHGDLAAVLERLERMLYRAEADAVRALNKEALLGR